MSEEVINTPKHLIPVDTYKEPDEFCTQQLHVFWLPEEIAVEKDIQDILVRCTPAERHSIITTLKLFSLYETHAGSEYWGGRYRKMFDGPEFERMASTFSMFELAVHAPFYNKINKLLHVDNPEFYEEYINDPAMLQRMRHIWSIIDSPDDLLSLAGFSLVEGVVLYSSFAFLKHFQSAGKNKMMNIVRGINFSVRDENLHSLAGAWSYNLKLQQYRESFDGTDDVWNDDLQYLHLAVQHIAKKIVEHEDLLIDKLFEMGPIENIDAQQLKTFVRSRANLCLQKMQVPVIYTAEELKDNPIAEWFYDGINNYQFNDFFSGQGREYNRNWDEDAFVWVNEDQEQE